MGSPGICVRSETRALAESESGSWLLELGATESGPVLLQRRPVSRRAPYLQGLLGALAALDGPERYVVFLAPGVHVQHEIVEAAVKVNEP